MNVSLKDVIDRHRAQVMDLPGVVGVAGGLSKVNPAIWCVQVYVATEGWPEGLPLTLDGYRVELIKTSGFRATRKTAR